MELNLDRPISKTASQAFAVATVASLILAMLVLRFLAPGPRVFVNMAVAALAAIGAGLWAWRAAWRPSRAQLLPIVLGALAGFLLGLLAQGSYAGDVYLYRFYQGFPFSWRHATLYYGAAALQKVPLMEYVAQHPELMQWSIDYRALGLDLVFGANIGVVIVTVGTAIVTLLPPPVRSR